MTIFQIGRISAKSIRQGTAFGRMKFILGMFTCMFSLEHKLEEILSPSILEICQNHSSMATENAGELFYTYVL